MNAYELAHKAAYEKPSPLLGECAVMLRQQADRIAELEKDTELCTTCGGFVFSSLCKQSAEPVAWMNEHGEISQEEHWAYPTPLYTTPQIELNAGGEPVKNATYWKRQYNEMSALNDRLKSSLYHANEQIKYLESTPQIKELSDLKAENNSLKKQVIGLLKKASEK